MLETPEVIINPGSIQAEIECNKDLEITLQKREFSIVGDNVYVTASSEAPQWLLDLINGTIANAIADGTADFDDLRENILNAIAAMNIAKNDYDSYVIKLEDAEGRLLAYTETLNATVADSVAQIVSTLVTKVTADEALTIAVDAIQSSINGGAIKAQIDTINTTLATESLSRATQVDTIMAAITDESSGLAANATAIEILDATVTANQTASATWQTNLETFLETGDTTGTTIDSQSNVYSTLRSDITSAESKFEYNSNLIINGHPYSSGFGLVSNLTVNSNDEPIAPNLAEGDSEFWIKADRFRLSDSYGSVPVFTIDAASRSAVFNGKVIFNGSPSTLESAVQNYVEQVSVGDKNINITDNLIPTTSLLADVSNAGYQFIGNPVKSSTAGIDAYNEPQVVLDSDDEVYSPYVDEVSAAYYYRFGLKTTDTNINDFKICVINISNTVTYTTPVITDMAGNALTLTSNTWYIIDGIINPYGGDSTTYSGSIRSASGSQIGKVQNYAMPTATSKILLGWQTSCTISRMKLSKITADTFIGTMATQDYVDTNYTTLQGTLEARDGLVSTFYQTTAPTTGMEYGDYWLDTDSTSYTVYRYQDSNGLNNGTLSWAVNTSAIATAIQTGYKAQKAADTAQITADTKIKTFYQPSVPTSSTAGDIWIDTDDGNKMYIANAANVNSIVTSGNGWYNKTLVVPAPDFTSNNDLFAQAQGFANFAEMEASYSLLGSTIINGGYINTDLIQAHAITSNMINTVGLGADYINTNYLQGIVIEGSRINGSVIKASYLDLDGDLQVLTDYHITTAMYNTNPSLYTDAIYISSDNEYRIPTISSITYAGQTVPISVTSTLTYGTKINNTIGTIYNGGLFPYNCANAGTNNKAAKLQPNTLNVPSSSIFGGGINYSDLHYGYWAGVTFVLYFGDVQLFTIQFVRYTSGAYAAIRPDINGITGPANAVTCNYYCGYSNQLTVSNNGFTCTASSFGLGMSDSIGISISKASTTNLSTSFSSTSNGFKLVRTGGAIPVVANGANIPPFTLNNLV